MVMVLFFYGLAFILMGLVLIAISRKEDFLGIAKNFWALAIFGIIHGVNSWVNMFVLRRGFFDSGLPAAIGAALLPISFTFLLIFGVLNMRQRCPECKWFRYIPVACLIPWFLAFATGKGFVVSGIMARYFICIPGIAIIIYDLAGRLVSYRKELPVFVFLSTIIFIFASGLFGFVSGLVVPEANFFPASLINYNNFIRTFGFPIQIIRIFTAILTSIAAFGMTGVFYKDKIKVRLIGGIRRKVLFFTVLFSSIILTVSILAMYFSGVFTLRQVTFSQQQAIVQLMANSIGEMIDSEVNELESYVANPSIWGAVIRDANLKYPSMPAKSIPGYFVKMDKQWSQSSSKGPAVDRYLNTLLSLRLKKFAETKGNIAEIFFTDKYGGLVVASTKTSDFYQADEDWWRKTFNKGKGSIFIGDMEFDESSNNWSITISVPVYDKDAQVVGVCKAVYNTLRFSEVVSKFEIGSTGRAILFDNTGELICQSAHRFMKDKSSVLAEWKAINESQSEKSFLSSAYIRRGARNVFLASWAVIPYKGLLQQGVKWFACVEQDTKEIFAGQELILLLYTTILFGILLVLSTYFSFLFVRLLIRPIEKMRLGMREIASGNLNYYLNLRSGDELEDLSDSFNLMIDTLRKTLVSKDALITEVSERKQAECLLEQSKDKLEGKAQELNAQLKQTEKTHEIMMSMLEDNNMIREALEKSLAELKQTQEMMVQVAKLGAVGQLASGVAHEVKNPLGIILQGINYLENKIAAKGDDTQEVLGMMKDGIVRADKIINGLLDFSKSTKLDFKQEDINSVLESSINLAQVSSRFTGVQIVREMARHLPKVKIDKNKMEQVFINVLVNAAQAMDNQGLITIRSYVKKLPNPERSRINKDVDYFVSGEDALIVEIEDTGTGISEENLKKIFDAFFSTKGPKGGAGLGLGICLSIVDMHKGLIDVESQLGKGTKVTITLKLATEG
ncbi:MAG: ATP-binding protein [Candidatus Omnitrophica bacterium]|jgi:signal transduction histidine kinase|nr:ATP-binding protein [Candidatus Omnitrophota bacterium]